MFNRSRRRYASLLIDCETKRAQWESNAFTLPSEAKQTRVHTLDQRGAAALMVMVVILAVGILLVSTTALIGVDDLEVGFATQVGSHVVLAAESCAEEAMLRISRDASYVGGILIVGASTCAVAVTGTPCGVCTIDIESTRDNFTRNIQVDVTVSGSIVDIISWEEQ